MAVIILGSYAYSYWHEAQILFAMPIIMLAALIARILSRNVWVLCLHWSTQILGMVVFAGGFIDVGWDMVLPTFDGSLEPRWPLSFGSSLLTAIVLVLSFSEPLWRGKRTKK